MAAVELLYGRPLPALASAGPGAIQTSPLEIGSADIEAQADAVFDRAVVLAPAGTLERRYVLAQVLRTLRPGGELIAMAPKDKGGMRLTGDLQSFGCDVAAGARRHHRIAACAAPLSPVGLAEAISAGALQFAPRLGLWSQPGVFSWDRIDPGTALLLEVLPPMQGRGVDLGCGAGVLARAVLASADVTSLSLIDIDARALNAARRNVADPRARFEQSDIRDRVSALLDFVVMNPPFHESGQEDRSLGQGFIAAAAARLKVGGVCWLVANVALPYEPVLSACFSRVTLVAQSRGYKVYEARK